MKVDKLIKKQIIKEASAHPEKYFPVKTLEQLGLKRQKCSKCDTMFWSSENRTICGDTNCVGEYTFIGNSPAKRKLEFAQTYLEFKKFMEKKGYTHIKRFPIVARWREDLDFNIASIIGFQPYVTKGVIAPPSELVIIPQNCLRFSDIDNVGYTGRHGTNFVMIGQLAFKEPKKYDQAKYVKDLFEWFTNEKEGMGIPKKELQIHEDAWVGGGDCGPSMEFFSRGLELGNQVYMWYDMSNAKDISDLKPLKIKVLDMGMGLERCCWFSKGSVNQYEASMTKVCKFLFEKSKLKPNWKRYEKFLPYSGTLNLDEIDDIDLEWRKIAELLKVDVEKLKKEVEPIAGIYSIADHTKTLLYALSDGALPSNVKGGYNLRLVLRRALDFIYKFNWDIDLNEVIALHAKEVKDLYSEYELETLSIKKIIDLEVKKYKEHKSKVQSKISNLIKINKELSKEDFIKYYISDGIMPEEIANEFKKQGKTITTPSSFFSLVTEYFESQKLNKKEKEKSQFDEYLKDFKPTELLYYKDSNLEQLDVNVIKEFELNKKKYIVLDKTLFYPTGGGQVHDIGTIADKKVVNVFKVGQVVVHEVR